MIKRFLKTITGGNSRYEMELLKAADVGDLTISFIDEMLYWRADINTMEVKDSWYAGMTPLKYYIKSGHATPEIVEYLLIRGANPNESSGGRTALFEVPHSSRDSLVRMAILKLLLSHGANANKKNGGLFGIIPLHYFAINCTDKEVEMLLNAGALSDINAKSPIEISRWNSNGGKVLYGMGVDGGNPLHFAIHGVEYANSMRFPVIQKLVDYGADVNFRTNYPYTPLGFLDKIYNTFNTVDALGNFCHYNRYRCYAEDGTDCIADLAKIREFLLSKGAVS